MKAFCNIYLIDIVLVDIVVSSDLVILVVIGVIILYTWRLVLFVLNIIYVHIGLIRIYS